MKREETKEESSKSIDPPLNELARKYNIEPFRLFCAYHLGITEKDTYEFQNLHQVAKRFGTPAGVIKQLLQDFGMDTDSIVHSNFDLASAQVDIMYVPEGVSRTALARTHYEAFRTAPRARRDWQAELARDAAENEKTFAKSSALSPATAARPVPANAQRTQKSPNPKPARRS